jgi:hypothetical protein
MSPTAVLCLFLMFPICMIVLMVWVRYMVEGVVMSAAQDLVDSIAGQLGKAKDEIVGEIARLSAAVAAGESVDLSALQALAQGLDDIVPDAVAEVPVPVDEVPVSEG